MSPGLSRPRILGTMIAYGFPDRPLDDDLDIAARLGAEALEILPLWKAEPDPDTLRDRALERGFRIHSAHGCWGGQSIRADRVDLGQADLTRHQDSVDDLKRCIDWLRRAGGCCLVVHPGGLSVPEEFAPRREALGRGLNALADHARGSGVVVCVENMPPGVFPGSRMADLHTLLVELDRLELALALDTGHAHMSQDVETETIAAGALLQTTHVHDNNGRQDVHLPPGHGTIDWDGWRQALDDIQYDGPVLLECIRHLRNEPQSLNASLGLLLGRLTGGSSGS